MAPAKRREQHSVVLASQGKGRLYYTIRGRFGLESCTATGQANGFLVTRSYCCLSASGAGLTNDAASGTRDDSCSSSASLLLTTGDHVEVTLTIQCPRRRQNVVVMDFLPGGFEVENPVLRSFSQFHASHESALDHSTENHFDYLPMEIILFVFSFLTAKELCVAARVCRAWRQYSYENCLWEPFATTERTPPRNAKVTPALFTPTPLTV